MSLYWEAGVMMMTRRDLRGRRAEQRKGLWKGGQREIVAPYLISLFKNSTSKPGRAECGPIISIHQRSWEGEDRRKGTQQKKNGFDIQADGLREATSSRPFHKTWPPAVWWIMEPQMGRQGWDPGRNAWEPSLPGRRESSWRSNKSTPGVSDISSSNSFLSIPHEATIPVLKNYKTDASDNTSIHTTRIDSLHFHVFILKYMGQNEGKMPWIMLANECSWVEKVITEKMWKRNRIYSWQDRFFLIKMRQTWLEEA